MGKWTRRAFISAGVLAGGVVVFGVAIRPGNRADKVAGLVAKRRRDRIQCLAEDRARQHGYRHRAACRHGPGRAHDAGDDAGRRTGCRLEPGRHTRGARSQGIRQLRAGRRDLRRATSIFPSWLVDTVDGFFLTVMKAMNMQITGGSTSVPMTGQVGMRVAGAATRAVLLEAAAEAWNVPVARNWSAARSQITHAASGRSAPYAEFAQRRSGAFPARQTGAKDDRMSSRSWVPMCRATTFRPKSTALPMFGIDAGIPGMKYATVKASPVFGATVQII